MCCTCQVDLFLVSSMFRSASSCSPLPQVTYSLVVVGKGHITSARYMLVLLLLDSCALLHCKVTRFTSTISVISFCRDFSCLPACLCLCHLSINAAVVVRAVSCSFGWELRSCLGQQMVIAVDTSGSGNLCVGQFGTEGNSAETQLIVQLKGPVALLNLRQVPLS
ncbi:hypothetical protein VPH35_138310 [Triticum aestivum]